MKNKIILFYLFCLYNALCSAQILQERRVYYLDCSYSMIDLGIWDKVRDNLKNAIDRVSDKTTELIVIPFTDDRKNHYPLPVYSQFATEEGKRYLKNVIDNFTCTKDCYTYHNVPLSDFISKRILKSKITYMFLMTDGKNGGQKEELKSRLRKWGKMFYNKNVFGFYVMLHDKAFDKEVQDIIKTQKHLWEVRTADVNINLVRLENEIVFNIRNEQYIDIPIYGNSKGIEFNAILNHPDYTIKSINNIKNKILRIELKNKRPLAILPEKTNLRFSIQCSGLSDFSFMVSDYVKVKCLNKKERLLKITIK